MAAPVATPLSWHAFSAPPNLSSLLASPMPVPCCSPVSQAPFDLRALGALGTESLRSNLAYNRPYMTSAWTVHTVVALKTETVPGGSSTVSVFKTTSVYVTLESSYTLVNPPSRLDTCKRGPGMDDSNSVPFLSSGLGPSQEMRGAVGKKPSLHRPILACFLFFGVGVGVVIGYAAFHSSSSGGGTPSPATWAPQAAPATASPSQAAPATASPSTRE